MNKLPIEKQILALQLLCEGNSIRSIERTSGVHRDTIMRLLVSAGQRAEEIMNERFINLQSNFIQADEIWTYVFKKRDSQTALEKSNREIGDQYVFVAMDSETKLVPAFYVGKRNLVSACAFIRQLRERIVTRFQLSTDSFQAYREAVERSFGDNIDFAQTNKIYMDEFQLDRRYAAPKIICIQKKWVSGNPKFENISTSHVERQNLTMRMQMRRFTRLTNAFSKKLENLRSACALHFFYYNFMRINQTVGLTPAMQSNVTNHIWSWEEFLDVKSQFKKVA